MLGNWAIRKCFFAKKDNFCNGYTNFEGIFGMSMSEFSDLLRQSEDELFETPSNFRLNFAQEAEFSMQIRLASVYGELKRFLGKNLKFIKNC